MIEAWKKALDEQKYAGAILSDLSKAFDCLNHCLLLVKLKAYGFENHSLKFIQSYLRESYLRESYLRQSYLRESYLRQSYLRESYLRKLS